MFFTPFLLSIFSARPSWLFCSPNFDRGLKTRISSDERRAIKNDHLQCEKLRNGPFCMLKCGPLKQKSSIFFSPIFSARPSWSFCTPELWSGTKNEDLQRWSPSDQKWSFTVWKVEKWAVLRAKMRPFEKKFEFLFRPSSRPVRAGRFAPPNFDRGLKTGISSDDRRSIKNDHLQCEKLKNGPFCALKFGPLKKKS